MEITGQELLDEFVEDRPEAESVISRWKGIVNMSTWRTPHEVRSEVPGVSILRRRRMIFDIGGQKYRIITVIDYIHASVEVRFVGTHDQYDRINAMEV